MRRPLDDLVNTQPHVRVTRRCDWWDQAIVIATAHDGDTAPRLVMDVLHGNHHAVHRFTDIELPAQEVADLHALLSQWLEHYGPPTRTPRDTTVTPDPAETPKPTLPGHDSTP